MEVSDEVDMKGRSYKITITLVNYELKLSRLDDYVSGRLMSIPYNILRAMNLVMMENPHRQYDLCWSGFFPKAHKEEEDLGMGITASRGFQPRLHATSQGLTMCLNYSVLPFQKRMSVIDFLGQHINGFDIESFQMFRTQVNPVLTG